MQVRIEFTEPTFSVYRYWREGWLLVLDIAAVYVFENLR
jgi:hypothetical protein